MSWRRKEVYHALCFYVFAISRFHLDFFSLNATSAKDVSVQKNHTVFQLCCYLLSYFIFFSGVDECLHRHLFKYLLWIKASSSRDLEPKVFA